MSHAFHASLDVGGYQARMAPGLSGSIGELVDGSPARLWTYLNSSLDSHRHATTVAAALGDGIELTPRFRVDAAIAYDGVSGSAEGASNGIGWHTLVPSASIRWVAGQAHGIAVVAAYRRAADPLLLDLLAFADPAAPSGSVSSWDGQGSGPLVARVGPGTGGNPGFSTIDGSLARPLTDEYSVGIEARPNPSTRLRLAGVAKRYRPAIDVVDVGAPFTSYAPSAILDFPAGGVQTLTAYDRQPASFGADRYVLTNPPQEKASLGGVMLTAERSANRLWLLVGATASLGHGPAASRGFHANENDVAAAGELFTNPNAVAFAKGRLFLDRAYTVKIAGIYRFSHDVRLGVILRYQDGQPFSRVLIVPGLNQGAEILRTHPAGDTRFAYTGTLDVRLQKGIVVGRKRIDVVVDAYNVINRGNEVEEDVVTGPAFRSVTAIQPPLAVHLGIRLTFGCPEPPVHPRVLRPNRRLADGAPARP